MAKPAINFLNVGFMYSYACPSWPKFPALLGNSGLIVLSKYNIEIGEYHSFKNQNWFEWQLVNRGALFAKIRPTADGLPVYLFTTHLTSGNEVLLKSINIY